MCGDVGDKFANNVAIMFNHKFGNDVGNVCNVFVCNDVGNDVDNVLV